MKKKDPAKTMKSIKYENETNIFSFKVSLVSLPTRYYQKKSCVFLSRHCVPVISNKSGFCVFSYFKSHMLFCFFVCLYYEQ